MSIILVEGVCWSVSSYEKFMTVSCFFFACFLLVLYYFMVSRLLISNVLDSAVFTA
jgi:hypothetical protein